MNKIFRSSCPISSLLDILGDKWSLLIVRDMIIYHKKTFKNISDSSEKIAPSILSSRLKQLESFGIISKYKLSTNKKENLYLLTDKGIDLFPIVLEYTLWSVKYMTEYNRLDNINGLEDDKPIIIQEMKNKYLEMKSKLKCKEL